LYKFRFSNIFYFFIFLFLTEYTQLGHNHSEKNNNHTSVIIYGGGDF
jgi:hypothetical protein